MIQLDLPSSPQAEMLGCTSKQILASQLQQRQNDHDGDDNDGDDGDDDDNGMKITMTMVIMLPLNRYDIFQIGWNNI